MSPEPFLDEHQRKRPKGSDPSPLPPGIWDGDLGVYDPYHSFSTTRKEENPPEHSTALTETETEEPFNAFRASRPMASAVVPRNVFDSTTATMSPEQTVIRAWFRSNQDKVAQLDDGFIRWLPRLLDQNGITPAEMGPLRMFKYKYQDYTNMGK